MSLDLNDLDGGSKSWKPEFGDKIKGKIVTVKRVNQTDFTTGEPLTWSDGSLGCARPGQAYTQALVPGYQVVLEVEGRQYDYRATERGYYVLCELPTLPQPSTNL